MRLSSISSVSSSPVSLSALLGSLGEMPLPPYLQRAPIPSDETDYQVGGCSMDG